MAHSGGRFGPRIDLGRQRFLFSHQRDTRERRCETQHEERGSVRSVVRNAARETVSLSKHGGAGWAWRGSPGGVPGAV
jgi:hypothetical protein